MSGYRSGPVVRVVAVAVAILGGAFLWMLYQPFAGKGHGSVKIFIAKKSSVGTIAHTLEENGIVSSAFFFEARATISGDRGSLKPGYYHLRKDMSYGAVIVRLTQGPPRNIVNIVVPEGKSRSEIAQIARQNDLEGSYEKASLNSPLLRPRRYGAQGSPKSLEGFLFPATYELKRGADVSLLVDKQLQAFKGRFATINLAYAKKKNLTPYDVLIIASMIEREAQLARERSLIAAVIYNRLHKRMPLGIDATTRYATKNWTRPLSRRELATPSPYNTRNRAGLPPTPIGNPGVDSIRAAARPARVSYLYYVVKPGSCGEHSFSSTARQFNKDSARYDKARASAGRSPTSCRDQG